MLDRRGFLGGVIQSLAGSIAAVRLATPAEAHALLKPEMPVALRPAMTGVDRLAQPGMDVFMEFDGRMQKVGVCTQVDVYTTSYDVTSFGGEVTVMPGLTRSLMRFGGRLK